ncbi:O-antigen ligase family protein [Lentisphaera profundi]|uniref:O-antigen ligase family protein n=1 Tax=Lentisphaera profundi TaxID=1658616 RepID=A0ABY7VV71_9BACT|nr:O-antigen ligase family protein [Lentisphaera profundi]WDE98120.1 O-antigen ligase family protein [Lentisphaera profundi]
MIRALSSVKAIEAPFFNWTLALLLLFGFPLAIIAPQGLALDSQEVLKLFNAKNLALNGFRFHIPAIAISAFLSFSILISSSQFRIKNSLEKKLIIFASIFLGTTLISAYIHKSSPFETLSMCAFVLVPLAISQFPKSHNPLPIFMGLYYWINITFYFFLSSPTGISANKNWLIAGIVASSPWAIILLRKSLYKFLFLLPKQIRNPLSSLLAPLLVWLITFNCLMRLNSRASWLAFSLILCYFFYRNFSSLYKKLLLTLLCIISLTSIYFFSTNYNKLTHNELRPLLWQGTAKMIEQAPLLGSAGPGQFNNTFPEFRLPAQLMLPIAAPNSSHPHNEPLRIASEIGLPGCLALICFYLLVFKSTGRKNYASLHAVLVLACCSLFDKLLIENATCLLFLINMGLLLPTQNQTRTPSQKKLLPFKRTLAMLIICLGSFIAINTTKASWFYRLGFNDQHRALFSLDEKQKKSYWDKSFQSYASAAVHAPYNTNYNYHAANAALMGLRNEQKAAPFLSSVIERAPQYININRLLSYYQELHYYKSQNPKDKSRFLKLAIQANAKELQVNGMRLSNISDGLLFALRHQFIPLAFQTQKLFKTQSVRLANYLFPKELKPTLDQWSQALSKDDQAQAITYANQLHQIKGLRYIDPLYIQSAPPSFKKTSPLDPSKFTKADFLFWRELIALRKEMDQHKSFVAFCQHQLQNIELNKSLSFYSPEEVLIKQKANPIALLSFFAQCANILGRPHLILETAQGESFILIQNGENSIFINAQKKHLNIIPHQSISSLLSKKKLKSSFFCSPQSFFSANTYLFSLYNSQFKEQSISLNTPSLNWMVSKQALGNNPALKIRTESFYHLAQQIKDF